MSEQAGLQVARLPDAIEQAGNSGKKVSLACNLPHGLTIHHRGQKMTINGANHARALKTDMSVSGSWGITHNVPEEWFDDWAAEHNHPAFANGHIIKNTPGKIEANAEAVGNAIKTGADQIDPTARDFEKVEGVEERTDDD